MNNEEIFENMIEDLEGSMDFIINYARQYACTVGDGHEYDECEEKAQEYNAKWEELNDSFWEFVEKQETQVCPDCGWWSECTYDSDEEHKLVCDECHENYSCEECGYVECECE